MAKDEHLNQDISFPDQKIVDINLEHEMENAYIEYAMSVIVGPGGEPDDREYGNQQYHDYRGQDESSVFLHVFVLLFAFPRKSRGAF